MRSTDPLVCVALALGCSAAPPTESLDGRYAMGSILEITLVGSGGVDAAALFGRLYDEVAELEALASRHDPESALSGLHRDGGAAVLDPRLHDLLAQSARYRELGGGAFDVSIGAWVALWVAAAERGRLPSEAERRDAAARTGADAFALDAEGGVTLAPGARLDLGAIAKGHALDRLRALLPESLHGALLNFGQSSYWAIGRPSDSGAWRLLLRDPEGGFAGVVQLRDQALSISASLGQSSEIEGRRYGHIVDPRSGEPLLRRAQVAVLAPSAAMAEALSTAALVLGRHASLAWVAGLEGCELLWLEAGAAEATPGWRAATRFQTEVK